MENKYYKNSAGLLHRENDLPAIEYINGDKHWYINGERHRVYGPAIIYSNGLEQWFINGVFHRDPKFLNLAEFLEFCKKLNNL